MSCHFLEWIGRRFSGSSAKVTLSDSFWAEAVLLGAARLKSNKNRDRKRDRQNQNPRVDLMGAASEVLLYRTLNRFVTDLEAGNADAELPLTEAERDQTRITALRGIDYMRKHLFIAGGGGSVEGADLVLGDGSASWSVDAKSYDCAPNKRFFAINAEKHRELGELRPQYFCMLCPPYAARAFVAVVPYAHVEQWPIRPLGDRTPPDPARVDPIGKFTRTFLGLSWTADTSNILGLHDSALVGDLVSVGAEGALRISESAPPVGAMLKADPTVLDKEAQVLLRVAR
jgi:hypothetical protein